MTKETSTGNVRAFAKMLDEVMPVKHSNRRHTMAKKTEKKNIYSVLLRATDVKRTKRDGYTFTIDGLEGKIELYSHTHVYCDYRGPKKDRYKEYKISCVPHVSIVVNDVLLLAGDINQSCGDGVDGLIEKTFLEAWKALEEVYELQQNLNKNTVYGMFDL